MEYKYDPNKIPDIVKEIFGRTEAYLVGGAARYALGLEDTFRDIDILIQYPLGMPVVLASYKSTDNSFGGRKYYIEEYIVDAWYADLGTFLSRVPRGKDSVAICLKNGVVFMTNEFINHYDEDLKRPWKVYKRERV